MNLTPTNFMVTDSPQALQGAIPKNRAMMSFATYTVLGGLVAASAITLWSQLGSSTPKSIDATPEFALHWLEEALLDDLIKRRVLISRVNYITGGVSFPLIQSSNPVILAHEIVASLREIVGQNSTKVFKYRIRTGLDSKTVIDIESRSPSSAAMAAQRIELKTEANELAGGYLELDGDHIVSVPNKDDMGPEERAVYFDAILARAQKLADDMTIPLYLNERTYKTPFRQHLVQKHQAQKNSTIQPNADRYIVRPSLAMMAPIEIQFGSSPWEDRAVRKAILTEFVMLPWNSRRIDAKWRSAWDWLTPHMGGKKDDYDYLRNRFNRVLNNHRIPPSAVDATAFNNIIIGFKALEIEGVSDFEQMVDRLAGDWAMGSNVHSRQAKKRQDMVNRHKRAIRGSTNAKWIREAYERTGRLANRKVENNPPTQDSAMAPGGIDLNTSSGMAWKDSKDGNGVEMNVDPAMVARIRRDGVDSLTPVVFKITPVVSIWPLVGLQAPVQA